MSGTTVYRVAFPHPSSGWGWPLLRAPVGPFSAESPILGSLDPVPQNANSEHSSTCLAQMEQGSPVWMARFFLNLVYECQ